MSRRLLIISILVVVGFLMIVGYGLSSTNLNQSTQILAKLVNTQPSSSSTIDDTQNQDTPPIDQPFCPVPI